MELAYYRAMKLDTDVSKIVGVPMVQPTYAPIPSRSAPSSFQQSIQPFTSHPIMPPQSPPTFPPRPFNPIRTQNPVPFVHVELKLYVSAAEKRATEC